jgi:hypothetical protein
LGYERSEDELFAAADFQLQAIKDSTKLFDEGRVGEAARLANAAYILIGRGKRHRSILDSAGQQESRLFRSSIPIGGAKGAALIACRITKIAAETWEAELAHRGRPALDDGQDLPFDKWWTEEVICTDRISLSREKVVRILRDKNGGAHFDPVISDPTDTAAILGEVGAFTIKNSDGTETIVPFALEQTMRQIVEEIWFSLQTTEVA